MRIVMVSKALVVGMYQRKAEEIAAQGVALTVAVPSFWREKGHDWQLEKTFTQGYCLSVLPMRFNGHYHVHFYPSLGRLLDQVKPDLLHFDDEAYNLSTWLALRAARRRGIAFAFFNWQNISRRYPPPFRWMEQDVLKHADLGLAGNTDADAIVREKGFRSESEVIPQFGIDPELFVPADQAVPRDRFTIGFVGRLTTAKGLQVLLKAVAGLPKPWELRVVGSGPDRELFRRQAEALGLADSVTFVGQVGSTSMPEVIRGFDVLVGPSLTTPRWKEQFGRMLVEAMACAVPVVGSDSGEIPRVIGSAGLVVPEGDVEALRTALVTLQADPALRAELGRAGRERALERFTQKAIAARTVAAYKRVLSSRRG